MTFEGSKRAGKAKRERVKGMGVCGRSNGPGNVLGVGRSFSCCRNRRSGRAECGALGQSVGVKVTTRGLVVLVEFGFDAKPDGSQWKVFTREFQKLASHTPSVHSPVLIFLQTHHVPISAYRPSILEVAQVKPYGHLGFLSLPSHHA